MQPNCSRENYLGQTWSNLGPCWCQFGHTWGRLARARGLLGSTLKFDHQTSKSHICLNALLEHQLAAVAFKAMSVCVLFKQHRSQHIENAYIVEMSKKLPEYIFNIVGISGTNTSNLFFHGYLNQKAYLEILETCHICIGSFGIHKYGLKESSPLKVREYLAYGYPTILGYKDFPITILNLFTK